MSRSVLIAALVLAASCMAQTPAPAVAPVTPANPELSRRVERRVRSILQAPPYVKIDITDRQPSKDFSGFDTLTVQLSAGENKQSVHFVISKDDKTMYSMTKMDLTKDPYEETMSKIDTTGRPVRGNKDAKVTVVVFDDFQCPFCSRMHQTITNSLKTYGDRIKVIYKDFPLSEMHPWAMRAAVDSQCLASQSSGAFWDFADYVHANGPQISGQKRAVDGQNTELDRIADDMGKRHDVDMTKLDACIKEQPQKQVDASMAEAEKLGINATPAVFVNGQKLEGAIPAAQFNDVLDKALRDTNEPIPAKAVEPQKPAGQ